MFSEKVLRILVEKKFTKTLFVKLPKKIPVSINNALSKAAIRFISRTTPIQDNKIIFLTFRGSYDCNPKWICEEIVRRDLPYQLVWAYRRKTVTGMEDFPDRLKQVRLGRLDFYKELSSAKLIVDNGVTTSVQSYKKKKGQYLIETWHGSLGIKKPSHDANKDKKWVKKAYREGEMTDYCISNSAFESNEVYAVDYWKNTPVWLHGHARNDILCEGETPRVAAIRAKVRRIYELNEDDKICLYAPTFRDDNDMKPYQLDYEALAEALKNRFGGNWVILTRFHYRIYKKLVKKKLMKKKIETEGEEEEELRIINATNYPDIQELALCTDVAITDYSSWICEYMLMRKPGFLFATDLGRYQTENRPFFFPLTDMPFPVAKNIWELLDNISAFDNEKYVKRCNEFLQEMGSVDDGHAAERTVDEIVKLMGDK